MDDNRLSDEDINKILSSVNEDYVEDRLLEDEILLKIEQLPAYRKQIVSAKKRARNGLLASCMLFLLTCGTYIYLMQTSRASLGLDEMILQLILPLLMVSVMLFLVFEYWRRYTSSSTEDQF